MEKLINLAKALKSFEIEEISIGLSKGELDEIEKSVFEFMDSSSLILNYSTYTDEESLKFKLFGVEMTLYLHKEIKPVPNLKPFEGDILDTKSQEHTKKYQDFFKEVKDSDKAV